MKKMITAIALLIAITGFSQSKYETAMKKNLEQFDSAKTTADFMALAAAFDRIAVAEKTQWLPYYYAGLALSIPAWSDMNIDKDANAAKILAYCDKAEAIEKNSEVYELRFMALMQQFLVDPTTRYATYLPQSSAAIKKGLEVNPKNPRLYYLDGSNLFNTPEQYGGGKAKAKPILEKSVEMYKEESKTRKPMYPKWGEKEANDLLAQCQ